MSEIELEPLGLEVHILVGPTSQSIRVKSIGFISYPLAFGPERFVFDHTFD